MSFYHSDVIDIDLEGASVHRSFLNHILGGGDEAGDRFGIRLKRNGQPVSMIGAACIGFFIRADGVTLAINGSVSEGVAYVTLPKAAYVIEGQFTLAIKVSGTGFANTTRIVDGTVIRTSTESLVDPANEIPDLTEIMAVISRAEEAAEMIDGISITASQITGTRYKIAITKE